MPCRGYPLEMHCEFRNECPRRFRGGDIGDVPVDRFQIAARIRGQDQRFCWNCASPWASMSAVSASASG